MRSIKFDFSLWQVNAFTNKLFSGNPAVVCLLPTMLPDPILQRLAIEHAQPATVFLVRENSQTFTIRWFTPETELNLCGHGILAAGYVIFNHIKPDLNIVYCQSPLERLTITRQQDLMTLDFPAQAIEAIDIPWLADALGSSTPLAIYQYRQERCMVVYANEQAILKLQPDFQALQQLAHRGIIVTAKGDAVDFVSRTFYPTKSIPEDAVTGASHCLLVPYWSKQLNKTNLQARQLSLRGGELFCSYKSDRIQLSGHAKLYFNGQASIEISSQIAE